jgi:hypothetical protein
MKRRPEIGGDKKDETHDKKDETSGGRDGPPRSALVAMAKPRVFTHWVRAASWVI